MTPELPKVSNKAEIYSSKSETWLKDSERAINEIAQQAMPNPYSGA
jgi:hypothetical protein